MLEFGGSVEIVDWSVPTCPLAEAQVVRRNRTTYYIFGHRNEHSGERFRMIMRRRMMTFGDIRFEFS